MEGKRTNGTLCRFLPSSFYLKSLNTRSIKPLESFYMIWTLTDILLNFQIRKNYENYILSVFFELFMVFFFISLLILVQTIFNTPNLRVNYLYENEVVGRELSTLRREPLVNWVQMQKIKQVIRNTNGSFQNLISELKQVTTGLKLSKGKIGIILNITETYYEKYANNNLNTGDIFGFFTTRQVNEQENKSIYFNRWNPSKVFSITYMILCTALEIVFAMVYPFLKIIFTKDKNMILAYYVVIYLALYLSLMIFDWGFFHKIFLTTYVQSYFSRWESRGNFETLNLIAQGLKNLFFFGVLICSVVGGLTRGLQEFLERALILKTTRVREGRLFLDQYTINNFKEGLNSILNASLRGDNAYLKSYTYRKGPTLGGYEFVKIKDPRQIQSELTYVMTIAVWTVSSLVQFLQSYLESRLMINSVLELERGYLAPTILKVRGHSRVGIISSILISHILISFFVKLPSYLLYQYLSRANSSIFKVFGSPFRIITLFYLLNRSLSGDAPETMEKTGFYVIGLKWISYFMLIPGFVELVSFQNSPVNLNLFLMGILIRKFKVRFTLNAFIIEKISTYLRDSLYITSTPFHITYIDLLHLI